MISREAKSAYYAIMGIPMRLSAVIYKAWRAPSRRNMNIVKVQLGPGQKNYLEGWINLDANLLTARCDVWANLENPLPFRNESVDVFYSHHVIEHLPDKRLVPHFREMFRCLKPGGLVRVGGPNGDMAVRKYIAGDEKWFGDFPDAHPSIGGKLKNFLLCRNEHLTILTPSYLSEIAQSAGFEGIEICIPGRSTRDPSLIDESVLELENWSSATEPHTLLVEALKPLQR